MGKLKVFLILDWKTKWLFLEAFLFLGWARVLKVIPFSKTSLLLGRENDETSYNIIVSNRMILKDISQAIQVMSRYTLWESMCLVKAIAAMKMLERRHIESTLYLGIAKDENGKLIAHAWLRSGPFYITGYEEMDKFIVVNKFAKKLSELGVKGEQYGG